MTSAIQLLATLALVVPITLGQTVLPVIPAVLPTNWTAIGCFSDVSTSRTLAATSLVQSNMTIELCIGFCSSGGFLFSGVEFGHCDSAIQVPSVPEPATDCDMACGGNSTELCGGPVRINIFQDTSVPVPVIVQNVTAGPGQGLWSYQGCFTDSVSARTLGNGVNIPGGTTAESCTAACKAAGGFAFAGLENGHECWCDNKINAPAQLVGDADCRELCSATRTEFCGNANRIAVYDFSASGTPPVQVCQATAVNNFTLVAEFTNPPTTGPSTVPLKFVAVEIVGSTVWSILSACPNCCTEWLTSSLSNSIVMPHSIVVPTQQMTSSTTNQGESPNFVASVPAFPGAQVYCTMTDPLGTTGSPSLLSLNNRADAFSLCTNTSANARTDVVFSPVTGHPHYSLSTCQPIKIQVIT